MDKRVIGFEVKEKPVPFGGIVLLIAMGLILLEVGFMAIGDLGSIINEPKHPFSYSDIKYELSKMPPSKPTFGKYEIKNKIPELYQEMRPLIAERELSNRKLIQKTGQLHDLEREYTDSLKKYEVGLSERMAKRQGIFRTEEKKKELLEISGKRKILEKEIGDLRSELDPIDKKLEKLSGGLKIAIEKAGKDFNWDYKLYKLSIFIVQLLFVIPLLGLTAFIYLKHKKEDSKYTPISVTLLTVSAILVLNVMLNYFWPVFLVDVIDKIWELAKKIPFFKFILYYFVMALVVLLFGAIVVYLLRRIYEPARVMNRRLRDKKCPYCELSLNLAENFCPKCGNKIKTQCGKCGKQTLIMMKHCASCGGEMGAG